MSERDRYPHGVPCWVDTAQPDPDAAIRFYRHVFGWDFAGPGPMPGDPPGRYFVARLRERDVAGVSSVPTAGAPPLTVWTTYVAVKSAEETAGAVRREGGAVIVPPFDALPAGRMAVLSDPADAVFCAWEARERQGAQLVNEPRAWAMSALVTRDPEACAGFYGAVFGWKTERFGTGPQAVTLFRLRGYVGGEPQQPVPRDVVAVMETTGAGNGRRAHWSVDFWIDSTDAAVARAVEMGGKVLVEPHDTPMFRNAVLQDSQGAEFSISQLRR